jgi:predicted DNA-binding transcriptional regulator AlpA
VLDGFLNDSVITNTQPDPAKEVRLRDGEGLHVVILPNGRRYWRWDYTYAGRRKQLSFGRYPLVTLKQARRKKIEAQWLLAERIDPSAARKHARGKETEAPARRAEHIDRADGKLRPAAPSVPVQLIDLPEVCRRTTLGRSTIQKLITSGKFPPRLKHPDLRTTRWSAAAVEAWIQEWIAAADTAK